MRLLACYLRMNVLLSRGSRSSDIADSLLIDQRINKKSNNYYICTHIDIYVSMLFYKINILGL